MADYIGREVATSKAITQVYSATHRGDDSRLPYMHRSFISFTFGGKSIEDFGLIAITDGDRMNMEGSSQFENITTSYDVVNGQLYWGTFFQGNTLSLELATDGITQRQLDDFLRWFRGGETRELILAQHPNRAIYARVSEPPSLSLLPFEKKEKVKIGESSYETSTTLYRGEISLSFQMDEPFWYAKENIFGYFDETNQIYVDEWTDANGNKINIHDSSKNKDAVKIMLEDGIPFSSMIADNMLLGNNIVANTSLSGGAMVAEFDSYRMEFYRTSENNSDFYASSYIVKYQVGTNGDTPIYSTTPRYTLLFDDELTEMPADVPKTTTTAAIEYQDDFDRMFGTTGVTVSAIKTFINEQLNSVERYYSNMQQTTDPRAIVADDDDDKSHALISGVYMTASEGIINLAPGNTNVENYFYYAGTAPAYPTLEFTLTPKIEGGTYYIMTPANSFAATPGLEEVKYNTFTIESERKQEFKFTTPNIYTSYNTAISLFINNNGKSKNDVYEIMQDNVKHYAVRAWAMRILDYMDTIDKDAAGLYMSYFFKDYDNDLAEYPSSATFSFDSKTGLAYGTFKYRDCTDIDTLPQSASDWQSYCAGANFIEQTENVGDMIKSDWLVIKDRNYPDDNHFVRGWTNSTTEGKSYSYKIYHDVVGGLPGIQNSGLQNVKLIYNNMYV